MPFSLLSQFLPLCLSVLGFFISLWIVIPAPTRILLRLGVGAPEISPWLVGINAIALLLLVPNLSAGWLYSSAVVCSLLSLLFSLLPLIQFPAANAQFAAKMQTVLGAGYLTQIPQTVQSQLRPHPLNLVDVFRGIPIREVQIKRGIVFANPDGESLKLNSYRPINPGKYPAIVVIYGGGWRSGSPDDHESFSRYLAAQGYSVVALDYRHAPQYRFPTQLEDVKAALSYIQTHTDDFDIDPERVALIGRSAGAQLAEIAAYQSNPFPVRAVVNYYGPSNLVEGYHNPPVPNPIGTLAILRDFLGGPPNEQAALYREASPIHYVKPNLPPTLLVYGRRDHVIRPSFGRQFHQKLTAMGNQAIFLDIPWAEHAFDVIFHGVSNQLALYYTERFLAWALWGGGE
ncbi:MAG: alpha/beta hydrolase [Leptolyngbyaceae cyanobacterium MO_188.B28]|nr:alpha/beta hydrolase [Leptolyngbyaceae cyanobacterium MO_188.B28]